MESPSSPGRLGRVSTELERAWAAGFFDGEGHVRFSNKATYHAAVREVTRRVSLLHRFRAAVGVGTVRDSPRHNGSDSPVSEWVATGENAERAMTLLLPYLGEPKREQWREARAACAVRRAATGSRGRRGRVPAWARPDASQTSML